MSENHRFFDRIIELVDADPFHPFDIRTSDGRAYMVDAPIYLARSRSGDTVTYYTPEDDRVVVIRVSEIVSLELANRPAA
jgi:hypothetical protein